MKFESYSFLAVFILGSLFSLFLYKLLRNFTLSRSRKRGEKGEVVAKKWLLKNGYEIVSEQLSHNSNWLLNSREVNFSVRPDFLVKKDDEMIIVEVKTGKSAEISHSKTRRQIREYNDLFPMYRIALFDATRKIFYEIDFSKERIYQSDTNISLFNKLINFILGAIFGSVAYFFISRLL